MFKQLIRGNTYRFDIEAISADGKPEWFDSGTGVIAFTTGRAVKEQSLDISRLPTQDGHYRVYYTIPVDAGNALYIDVRGTIHSLPAVFKRTRFFVGG